MNAVVVSRYVEGHTENGVDGDVVCRGCEYKQISQPASFALEEVLTGLDVAQA